MIFSRKYLVQANVSKDCAHDFKGNDRKDFPRP